MRATIVLASALLLGSAGVAEGGDRPLGQRGNDPPRSESKPKPKESRSYFDSSYVRRLYTGFGINYDYQQDRDASRDTRATVVGIAPLSKNTRVVTGRVDTDIVPNTSQVYLDGVLVGVADKFDGWPRTLHTTAGPHQLSFEAPGYQSHTLTVSVETGRTTGVKLKLKPLSSDG